MNCWGAGLSREKNHREGEARLETQKRDVPSGSGVGSACARAQWRSSAPGVTLPLTTDVLVSRN